MELQFEKKTLPYLQTVIRQNQTQEQTQEVRLPEGMPDIGRVIACWGQVIVRGKEWLSDRVGANGGVMAWVLYMPEDESTPQAVSTWLPFQMKWDIPQTRHDGTIMIKPYLRSADARSLSPRKLMVRVNLALCVDVMVPTEIEFFQPDVLPEDIRILKNTYPMCLPMEAGEKAFVIEETFSLSGQSRPEQVVRYELTPSLTEWKLMADKIVFRGNLLVYCLYRGEDGQLYTWKQEIPFSQYGDLDREYEESCQMQMVLMMTNGELDITAEGQLRLNAGISGQYVIYDKIMVPVVEDACSSQRQINIQTEDLLLPAVLEEQTKQLRVEQTVDSEAMNIIDLAFYPDYPQKISTTDGVQIQMPGAFQLLYTDTDGNLQSTNAYWEENLEISMSPDNTVNTIVQTMDVPQAVIGGGVSMQADILCNVSTIAQQGLQMVCSLELGEQKKLDPNRPSLVLRRAGNDTLWQIAKLTGSTVEGIMEANHLTGEPEPEKMLLIPIE